MDVDNALGAAVAGADFLGLVFAPSWRQIIPKKAQEIAEAVRHLKPRPAIVGVFVNAPPEEVNRIAETCRLDWVQLSGDESREYCSQIARPIIKVIHVSPHTDFCKLTDEIEDGYRTKSEAELLYLLDTKDDASYGGTGKAFDWRLARQISARHNTMVAGGLDPSNVRRLIEEAAPWGVDVSSGVETDGRKDILKIKTFIEAVRRSEIGKKGGSHVTR